MLHAQHRSPDSSPCGWRWHQRTNAQIFSERAFLQARQQHQWHIVGVAGYARDWSHLGLDRHTVTLTVADARNALLHEFSRRQHEYGQRLVIASGATNQGVLQLTYDVCHELQITAMGIAPDQALDFPLGTMELMLPCGQRFGDESALFVRLIDELVVLGGGAQTRREVKLAAEQGRPMTVIQGFGGAADDLTPAMVPTARFVRVASPMHW